MEYSEEEGIILKEYGRNVQKIVKYILSIEDREKRSRFARTLVELMKQINPTMRDAQDTYQKIWDHLYVISGFKLDVDSPYPMPEVSILSRKPMKVEYNTHNLRFRHYGRNVELLIQKAIDTDDPEEKEAAISFVGKLMKRFYSAWNKESIDDEIIIEHLRILSNNKLDIDVEKVKSENLFDSNSPRERDSRQVGGSYGRGRQRKQSDNKRRNSNN
ncbi:DUF4290 domain-containing protein [Cytophagaceae bacterium ABcell3]|nr:DUF4290 domain-containing protein [Cytophagaceae bacterium ABcell3]